MRHFARPGIYFLNSELFLASEAYLLALFPSGREQVWGAVGGFLIGLGGTALLSLVVLQKTWGLLASIPLSAGLYCWYRQRQLRVARETFRKSEEAKAVNAR